MKATVFILTLALATLLRAQDLAPELAPLAAKYKADIAALEAQKSAALARAEQTYSTALDGVEKTATAAGKLEVVAAVTKERESIKGGLMAPALPSELPKSLGPARKAYMDAAARAAAEIIPKRRAANAEYLRALASLQPKAAGNAELARQIATEKERLLSNAAAGVVGPKPPGSSRNVVVNGTFDLAETDGRPKGWSFYGPGAEDIFKVVRDGTNSVLRLTVTPAPLSVGVTQSFTIPERAKSITISGRVRGKLTDLHKDDSNAGANISTRQLSAEKKEVGWTLIKAGTDSGWKLFKETAPIKTGAREVSVSCVGWWVAGTFDFDDIEVEFR